MGKQHTAKDGKPGFKSYKDASSTKKKPPGNKQSNHRSTSGTARRPISGNDDLVQLQAAHPSRCPCVTCLIAKGDRENEKRISARLGYRPSYC